MKKVFVLITEVIVDGAYERELCVKIYEKIEDAQKAFKEFADTERKVCTEAGCEVTDDDENHFSAQIEGEFAYNHSSAWVVEREVL